MNRVCLDTSAYSHFRRGTPATVRALARADEVLVPAVVLGELHAGFLLGSHRERNETELAEFLDSPAVRVADVDAVAAELYAELVVELRKAGTPVPTNDLWIAAVALRDGAMVVTHDAHFRAIPRVGCHVLGQPG